MRVNTNASALLICGSDVAVLADLNGQHKASRSEPIGRGGEARMTAPAAVPATAVPAHAVPRMDPAAAVELVGRVQRQMARLIQEHERGANVQPNVAYQLAGALGSLLQDLGTARWGALDAEAPAYVRESVLVGRRLDMTQAFNRLNPSFGVPAEHGCWDATPEQRTRRAAVQRRELELSMGKRFARMLAPAEGGEAA